MSKMHVGIYLVLIYINITQLLKDYMFTCQTKNNITYDAHANIERIVSDAAHRRTMLTSSFEANQIFEDVRELTYCDFPSKWKWDESSKT
jgi:hypothetical protein